MSQDNWQEILADQRDGYMRALEVLASEASLSAIKRAVTTLETDDWWRQGGAEHRADFGARELRALYANEHDRRSH